MTANVQFASALLLGFGSVIFLLGTAFTKISIIFLILRNALGLQQAPSNNIIFALAMIISLFISMPILTETMSIARQQQVQTLDDLIRLIEVSHLPMKKFLMNNVGETEITMVQSVAERLWQGSSLKATTDHFIILLTSFVISELTSAFEIGFLLFLPFVAIDLIITTILMALGMMMVSPTILSVPFKLLLFVAVGGWAKLFTGLTLSYSVM